MVYYNSRGVGKSTSWPSFTGKTEGSDLEALVQHFLEGHPQVDSVTFIVRRPRTRFFRVQLKQQGYSHGSLIVTLHPVLPSHIKTSYVLLSYPLGPRGLLTMFHSKTYSSALTSLLRNVHARLLIVHGDRDDFTSHAQYNAWTDSLKTTEGLQAELRVETIAGAEHFWHTETSRATLRETLESWLV